MARTDMHRAKDRGVIELDSRSIFHSLEFLGRAVRRPVKNLDMAREGAVMVGGDWVGGVISDSWISVFCDFFLLSFLFSFFRYSNLRERVSEYGGWVSMNK